MNADIDSMLVTDGRRWRAELEADHLEAVERSPDATELPAIVLDPAQYPAHSGRSGRTVAAAIGVAAILLLGLVGLGLATRSQHTGTDSAPTQASASVDPLKPPANGYLFPDISPSPATTAEPNSTAVRLSMPWKLSSISPDGKTITIYYAAGDGYCVVSAGIVVQQTNEHVTIQPVSMEQPGTTACPSVLKLGWVRVTLNAPLGNRKLLHPAVSADWKNSLQ